MMANALLIHNDNTIVDSLLFSEKYSFGLAESKNSEYILKSNIDKYISDVVIPYIKSKDFDILFIKDNLSNNYLDFYGLLLSYHIRLSEELENKRYVPIIILSDITGSLLNNLTDYGRIIFTQDVYIIKNNEKSASFFKTLALANKKLDSTNFYENFLSKIDVKKPIDYLSNHGISNEWSIYRWANYLKIPGNSIDKINENISCMLYFKYLTTLYPEEKNSTATHNPLYEVGKVLYIDDEWDKGWNDILGNLLSSITYKCVEEKFKDKNSETIMALSISELNKNTPDLIILDLRLNDQDFLCLTELTGIKLLKKIKEINKGIQVIVFTASQDSLILEQLFKEGIIGYIKKEHPNNYELETSKNIRKFISLINEGLSRKYLKEIFIIENEILKILNKDPISKYIVDEEKYKYHLNLVKKNIEYVFNILDTNLENKFNYAMVSIATSLESIVKIFMEEKIKGENLFFWDDENSYLRDDSRLEDKINKIIEKFGGSIKISLEQLITHRNRYMHCNTKYEEVDKTKILEWFKELREIITDIDIPPSYIPYVQKRVPTHHCYIKKK